MFLFPSLNCHFRAERDGSQATGGCTATLASLLSTAMRLPNPSFKQATKWVGTELTMVPGPCPAIREDNSQRTKGRAGKALVTLRNQQNWRGARHLMAA